jgi:hypothetical protein
MRRLVTAGKHFNSIRAIAGQPPITTIELLGAVFSVGPVPGLNKEDLKQLRRVSNTTNIALRVIAGDKREPSASWYKYGDRTLQAGGVSNLRQ